MQQWGAAGAREHDGRWYGFVFRLARYTLNTALGDTAILSILRLFLLLVAFARRPLRLAQLGGGMVLAVAHAACCTLAVAKCWTYTEWESGVPSAFVIAGALASLVEVQALRVHQRYFPPPPPPADAAEIGAAATTKAAAAKQAAESAVRWRKMALVLRPYFLPEGLQHRLLVALTWACLLSSKLANLWAPLFLGSAIQQLSESKSLPLGQIVAYSALMLANKVFKELQTIAYIKVKQTAYRELARTTFAHLHSLSLEWHLQKKMGEVLRAMDRGVSAADNMVSYLFLYLLPAIAECVVTFMIFYTHFKIVGLASIAFLSFAL